MHWLIMADAPSRARIKSAHANESQMPAEYAHRFSDARVATGGRPINADVVGSVARIGVSGVLLPQPSALFAFFGIEHTAYVDIVAALEDANANPDVESIVLDVNSPGGAVDGMFEAIEAIEASRKPIRAHAQLAASAAYGLAAATGRIDAASRSSVFGSIGVAAEFAVDDSVVSITSTEAPDKRPDPSTPEGQAVIRRHLDATHALFAEAIARGRGTTPEQVNANYGRGAVMLAAEAADRGMIDSFPRPSGASAKPRATAAHHPTERSNMDINELKAQHPHLFEQVLEQGRAEGCKAERRRCADHLMLGAAAGIPEKAAEAVAQGTAVTDMQATYFAAHMNRADIAKAQADGDEAASASSAAPADDTASEEDRVHEMTIALMKGGF